MLFMAIPEFFRTNIPQNNCEILPKQNIMETVTLKNWKVFLLDHLYHFTIFVAVLLAKTNFIC